jgi:hypothetical protein
VSLGGRAVVDSYRTCAANMADSQVASPDEGSNAGSCETTRPPFVVNRPGCTSDSSVLERIRGSRPSQADRHRRPNATTDSPDYNHDHTYDHGEKSNTLVVAIQRTGGSHRMYRWE